VAIGLVSEEVVSSEPSGDGYAIERVDIAFTIGLFQGVAVYFYVRGWSVTVVPSCSIAFQDTSRVCFSPPLHKSLYWFCWGDIGVLCCGFGLCWWWS